MVERLIVGSGSLVQTLVDELQTWPGSVAVGTADESLATTLRETGIDAAVFDADDERALAERDPDVVFVAQDTTAASLAAARAVRRALPSAHLLVYASDGVAEHGEALDSVADTVVDPGQAVATHIVQRVCDAGGRLRQLWQVLRDIDRLAVVTHDNPDPDAIASGIALARLADAADCEATVCYYGTIAHQENQAFVNVLGLDLQQLDSDADLSEFDGIALVDHSRPGVNDRLSPDTAVDIVIDHHPPRAPVDARFVDLRSDVGATSTLMVEYLDRFGLGIETDIATALLFGIHVDTNSFMREASHEDFEAAATLLATADLGTLERIESPSISPQTFETIASAIQNRQLEGAVLFSCVGELSNRDALAQAADQLLGLDGVTATIIYGMTDGTIYVSARASGSQLDIGETLRDAFDEIGSAGGHVDMAGAQIGLGVLEAVADDNESLQSIVEEFVVGRFLDAATTDAVTRADDTYEFETDVTDRYVVTPPTPTPGDAVGPDAGDTLDADADTSRDITSDADVTDTDSGSGDAE
jgi:nanoRNase/pAp phosphatase (c-di-AMP/oligoRNAs hydrolase)